MLLQDMPCVLVYIDNILTLTKGSYEQHLNDDKMFLQKLRETEMQLNIDKSYFTNTEVEYLGRIIYCENIKPQLSKV